jgi:hypothetical protein
MAATINDWLKKPLESVDLVHKVWDALAWIGGVILPIVGPRLGIQSPTLAYWIASGSGLGGLFGFYVTVALWSGKGRERCIRQSVWNFRWVFLPLLLLVSMLCILSPELGRHLNLVGDIHDLLIDLPLIANVSGFLCAFWFMARIIGFITLLSAKLWDSQSLPASPKS